MYTKVQYSCLNLSQIVSRSCRESENGSLVMQYSPYWVLRILDVKIIGTGIFGGQRVDHDDVRSIKDRTMYIEFRL